MEGSTSNFSAICLLVCFSSLARMPACCSLLRLTAVRSLPRTTPQASSRSLPNASAISSKRGRRSFSASNEQKFFIMGSTSSLSRTCDRTFCFSATLMTGMWKSRTSSGESSRTPSRADRFSPYCSSLAMPSCCPKAKSALAYRCATMSPFN